MCNRQGLCASSCRQRQSVDCATSNSPVRAFGTADTAPATSYRHSSDHVIHLICYAFLWLQDCFDGSRIGAEALCRRVGVPYVWEPLGTMLALPKLSRLSSRFLRASLYSTYYSQVQLDKRGKQKQNAMASEQESTCCCGSQKNSSHKHSFDNLLAANRCVVLSLACCPFGGHACGKAVLAAACIKRLHLKSTACCMHTCVLGFCTLLN